jgi:hypothetical protein
MPTKLKYPGKYNEKWNDLLLPTQLTNMSFFSTTSPTEEQKLVIPMLLQGEDILWQSDTATDTLVIATLASMLNDNQTLLIVTPTASAATFVQSRFNDIATEFRSGLFRLVCIRPGLFKSLTYIHNKSSSALYVTSFHNLPRFTRKKKYSSITFFGNNKTFNSKAFKQLGDDKIHKGQVQLMFISTDVLDDKSKNVFARLEQQRGVRLRTIGAR